MNTRQMNGKIASENMPGGCEQGSRKELAGTERVKKHPRRHVIRTKHAGFLEKYKSTADFLALMIGFTLMMAGCMLTVRSMSTGISVFLLGFLLFWV